MNALADLQRFLNTSIIGQSEFIQQLLVALIADGHILVEGPPGLAKTRAVKTLASGIQASFHRVQFTPDLLPADLTGTDIFRQESGEFKFQPGPLFHNILLADEINRAPAKVQSALLEAMAESQITVGRRSYGLPELFMVMATQNPLEQEGTYPLPEAQLDRFMLKVNIDYPGAIDELKILALNEQEAQKQELEKPVPLTKETLFEIRQEVMQVKLAPQLAQYIVDLIIATRGQNSALAGFKQFIEYGASPRATMALARGARAKAWLEGRDFVTPDDIQTLAYPVLRHRLLLTYQAQAKGMTSDAIIDKLIEQVAIG
ncbi:MoxR family ATPase [Alginatibacterium sediminis]|uniref:MoxR family ATPase n=2 Tax=Alginatibacterium sediminis TaxID=2164068 RepID=A0A420EG89_9ALTE|nr:MoxR family ATPase [Alginatibacterium sediminis]RKF19674.1 MoxR family ATPase [Alginatibacterium sediminis]